MRTYGRISDINGNPVWIEVDTDAKGDSSYVYVTTLIQCLKLVTGESPFFANYGIGAISSVMQQIFPDFDVIKTQQQFAPYFANLQVSKVQSTTPTYNINVITKPGAQIQTAARLDLTFNLDQSVLS